MQLVNTALGLADRKLFARIHRLATALNDGPARWIELRARVEEAKKRRLHEKLKVEWSEFLGYFSLTADGWSRIRASVDICEALEGAGLPMPRNQGQTDQLREYRYDHVTLVKFWHKVIEDWGSVPPAKVIAMFKEGIPVEEIRRLHSEPVEPKTQSIPPQWIAIAKEYLDLLGTDELFLAHGSGQKLASLILGLPVDSSRVWPRPSAPARQLEIPLDDKQLSVKPRQPSTTRRRKMETEGQFLLGFDSVTSLLSPAVSGEIREIRGIAEDTSIVTDAAGHTTDTAVVGVAAEAPLAVPVSPAEAKTYSGASGLPTVKETLLEVQAEEIREICGNSEPNADVAGAVFCPDAQSKPTVEPSASSFSPSKDDTGIDLKAEMEIAQTDMTSIGSVEHQPSQSADFCAVDHVVDASPASVREYKWGPKDEYLASEYKRAGAKVISQAVVERENICVTLEVTVGGSAWKDSCPTPPWFTRTDGFSTITFSRTMPLARLPGIADEIRFSVLYLLGNGNMEPLMFLDHEIATAAQKWLRQQTA